MLVETLYDELTQGAGSKFKRDVKHIIKEFSNCNFPFVWENAEVSKQEESDIRHKVQELKSGVPVAYVIGSVPFCDCRIYIDNRVLIPRPETELLGAIIIDDNRDLNYLKVLDLCTGSGCLAVALAKNMNSAFVTASDISADCLDVASFNEVVNEVKIDLIQSDLFENINDTFDIIVSNPPYLTKQEMLTDAERSVIDNEPHLALYGGEDGLDFYRRIFKDVASKLTQNGCLYLEVGDFQAETVKEMLPADFEEIEVIYDYADTARFIKARRKY